jgi:hypothetical protein
LGIPTGCEYASSSIRVSPGGQSVTALRWCSDVDLLGDGERVISL